MSVSRPLAPAVVSELFAALAVDAPAPPAPPAPRKPGTTAQRRCIKNWRDAVVEHNLRVQAVIEKVRLDRINAVNRYNLSTGGRAPEMNFAPAKNLRIIRRREREENREQLELNYVSCATTGGMPPADCRAPCKRKPLVLHW